MILNGKDKEQYLERPDDALNITLEVVGDTLTITFNNTQNSDYIVTLKDLKDKDENALEDSVVYKFTSTYSPLLATPRQIVNDIGNIFTDSDIDKVLYTIRSNSINVQYMTSKTIDWNNPPYEAKQYVRYQTDLDLLVGRYSETSAESRDNVTLGDFSIGAGSSGTTAFRMLTDEMRKRAEYWKARLGNIKSTPKSFLKGGTTWPDHLTRGF
ncbi:MAG TPA: hypothetical protein VK190_03220 [Pseudoneobacillus sp.]|jgi:hypothetical protein|nr:hypothetical protein [Pseudoneobacillus sp.]